MLYTGLLGTVPPPKKKTHKIVTSEELISFLINGNEASTNIQAGTDTIATTNTPIE